MNIYIRCHAKKHEPKKREKQWVQRYPPQRIKIAHTFKDFKKERGMTLGFIKIQKDFTHLHNHDQSV
jgi:hypothetical protein